MPTPRDRAPSPAADGLADSRASWHGADSTCPSPMSGMLLEHFHGAVSRVPVEATAFPHRSPGFNLLDRVASAYGVNHERLRQVKRQFDPDNLFRINQNILPA